MISVDEFQALTQSIGEHAVQALGKKHLRELSVVLSPTDMTCVVSVDLRENTDAEQNRAIEKLFEVRALFFDDVAMSFDFGVAADLPESAREAQRQFSFV